MSGLRVLLISPYPLRPGKVVGGVEAVTSALASALAAQTDVERLTVLCFHHGEIASQRLEVNDKLQVWFVRGQNRLALPTRALWQVLRGRWVASQLAPDVVHGQGIGTIGDIATRIGETAVVTAHGMVHLEARATSTRTMRSRIQVRLIDAMVQRVLRRAKVVISTSDYDARTLDGLICGQRVSIPNPVSTEFFAANAFDLDSTRILFAGMLIRRKNVEGLLRAFALVHSRVPEARLVVVGPSPDPDYRKEIHEQVAALRIDEVIEFQGHVENAELRRQLRSCRALVLFSQEETSPTIIAQAMASGRPVVTSRVGGIPEMVGDGENGFLVQPSDEYALADRLVTLLQSPQLGYEMGTRGHEMALRMFEPSAVARRTVDAYRMALGSRHV